MTHRNCRCAAAGCRAQPAMPSSPSAYPLVLRGLVMFRQSLLPRACFGVALSLAVIAPTAPARSQDRLTLERLDRLERDLNMLQRQVYRGAPAPMMGGDPSGAASGEVRMDRLEQQMRELTGRVEEFVNQIDQLRQRVEQVNGDAETRVGQTPSPSGSYAAATEAALKAFVEQHPRDPMAGNAQYWLGETYYTRGRFIEAASAFAEGYKRYPKGTKAPDELLKLGMSLARANQKQNACVALAQLDHDFPSPGAAIKDRATTEKKRLGC